MKKNMKVGFFVGIISGIAGLITAYLISTFTDLWFDQLNWFSILLASIVTNIVGAFIFAKLDQKSTRSIFYYALITIGVTLLMTINDIAKPPADHFGVVAHPVHVIVAFLTIWLVPKLTRLRASGTTSSNRAPVSKT